MVYEYMLERDLSITRIPISFLSWRSSVIPDFRDICFYLDLLGTY